MKKIIAICLGLIFGISINLYAQNNYNLDQFPNGTTTVSILKSTYTTKQIQDMLDNVDILRNIKNKSKFGFIFIDPNTFENKLVCDDDTIVVIFEYIKKLRQELLTVKQRLQSAGIP